MLVSGGRDGRIYPELSKESWHRVALGLIPRDLRLPFEIREARVEVAGYEVVHTSIVAVYRA